MSSMRAAFDRVVVWGVGLALVTFGLSCQWAGARGVTQKEADRLASVYLQARNTVNLGLLDGVYDPAVVVHDCGVPADIRGLGALKAYYEESHAGLPDFKMEFDEVLVSGEKLIVPWTVTGTHTRPLRGLPPTGKKLRFSGVAIDRVANGKFVEEWVYYNVLDVAQQLGFSLTPPAAPATS